MKGPFILISLFRETEVYQVAFVQLSVHLCECRCSQCLYLHSKVYWIDIEHGFFLLNRVLISLVQRARTLYFLFGNIMNFQPLPESVLTQDYVAIWRH